MNHLSSIIVALVLCLSSAALVAWHIRAWKRLQREVIDLRERDFRRRQFRRRMQTSAMLGVLGAAIFVGQLLMPGIVSQLFLVMYWTGVVVLVVWVALLALADMAATSFYYSRERNDYVAEQARLHGELLRARDEKDSVQNGKPGSSH